MIKICLSNFINQIMFSSVVESLQRDIVDKTKQIKTIYQKYGYSY